MIATFMNNIQIQIDRVHIRYEDNISVPGKKVQVKSKYNCNNQHQGLTITGGMCLQSLTAETTNSKWKAELSTKFVFTNEIENRQNYQLMVLKLTSAHTH